MYQWVFIKHSFKHFWCFKSYWGYYSEHLLSQRTKGIEDIGKHAEFVPVLWHTLELVFIIHKTNYQPVDTCLVLLKIVNKNLFKLNGCNCLGCVQTLVNVKMVYKNKMVFHCFHPDLLIYVLAIIPYFVVNKYATGGKKV